MPAFWKKAWVASFVVSHLFSGANWTPFTESGFADVPVLPAVVTAVSSALPIADEP